MSFTFATLKTAIQDYTENNESTFVTHLPDFIKTAEERILKNVQLSLFRKNQSGSATQNDRFLAVPSDFLAPFSLSVTSSSEHVFLDFKDTNFVQTYNPDSSNTGVPRYYAVFDINNFILGPTPNANFSVELHYYYRPTSLTAGADSGTTWLSENAPNCMLYGALIEAYVFMKGEQDMMAMYDKRFTEALVGLKQFGEAKETTDQYQTGMVIRPKQ
jgi:hypothetical protein